MTRPYLIGLTGSIGMGKSATAQLFADHGIPVWDADAAVHRLYDTGGAAVAPLAALYPAAIKAGQVDRQVLKEWIGNDPTALPQIETVVHPLVEADRATFIEKTNAPILLLDIPLLFEIGSADGFDFIAVVSTSPEEQRRRALKRPGMTPEHFENIIEKQMPDAQKRAKADVVIDTTTREAAKSAVDAIITEIKQELSNA